jgi:hypothetical protein
LSLLGLPDNVRISSPGMDVDGADSCGFEFENVCCADTWLLVRNIRNRDSTEILEFIDVFETLDVNFIQMKARILRDPDLLPLLIE